MRDHLKDHFQDQIFVAAEGHQMRLVDDALRKRNDVLRIGG